MEQQEKENERLSAELGHLTEKLLEARDRDAERYDKLLEKQEEILDSRLGLRQEQRPQTQETPRPIARRRNFGQIRADFEKSQRAEHWTKVIEAVEKKDAETAKKKTNG